MPGPELRGHSTATGTNSVTISVPAGTANGDGLALSIYHNASLLSLTIPGWTARGLVSGGQFTTFVRQWRSGDPTSVTVTVSAATAMTALMYGFKDSAPGGSVGSIPSGGTDTSKIECPGGADFIYVAFGGLNDSANPQSGALTGDAPLTDVVNVSAGGVRLVGGWDATNTSTNRHFSGVNTTNGARSGIGCLLTYSPLIPPVVVGPSPDRANIHWRFFTRPDPVKIRYIASGHFASAYFPQNERSRAFNASFKIITSEDGVTWNPGVIPGFDLYGDAWFLLADGRNLVMGGWFYRFDDGSDTPLNVGPLVSTDGGASWTQPQMPVEETQPAYLGAVGSGRFVVTSGSFLTPTRVYTCPSSSPTTWSVAAIPGFDEEHDTVFGLYFFDGRFLVAILSTASPAHRLALSDDGVSWEERSWPFPFFGRFVSDGTRWLGVGSQGHNYQSLDRGETWTQAPSTTQYVKTVAYHNGLYVAGTSFSWPSGGSAATRTGLLWSADGLDWTKADPDPFNLNYGNALTIDIWDVYWDGDLWWAAGVTYYSYLDDYTDPDNVRTYIVPVCVLANSRDGKAWTQVDIGDPAMGQGSVSGAGVVCTSIQKLPPAVLLTLNDASTVTGSAQGLRARPTS